MTSDATPSANQPAPRGYQPKPGSKVEAAVNYIRQKGSVRGRELASVMDVEVANITNILAPAVAHGVLVKCDVEDSSGRRHSEYRIGSGIPDNWRPLKVKGARARAPDHHDPSQPAAGQTTGTASSGAIPPAGC